MRNRSVLTIAFVILAWIVWRSVQRAASYELRASQLTFDPGLAASPAISPDGRTVAYASDRDTGGNLELYVQPARGGAPLRLTNGSASVTSADFSPDGATLVFTAGGSVYTIPASGGAPHRLTAGGTAARYSTDGRWIAYANAGGISIVDARSEAARRFHPEFHSASSPAWSPDSARVIFWADGELRVAPRAGGAAESTGIQSTGPITDAVWTTAYGLIFSARTGLARNLYRCPVTRDGKPAGSVVSLTNGTELLGDPGISREGRAVFSSARERFDIWGVPLDAATGKAAGPPYRITDTLAPTANPDISTDGKRLLFSSSRNGYTEVWEKDLSSGKEWVAATGPEGASYGRFLKSSGGILCVKPAGGRDEIYIGDRKLAVGARPWDADTRETTILIGGGAGIDAWDAITGACTRFIQAPPETRLSEASFSPDGRWVLFRAETNTTSRVFAASPSGGAWLPITDNGINAGNPRFSPDGRVIYFTLERDGEREIDALRFDVRTGAVTGESFAVFHAPAARLSLTDVNPQALSIAVARDKLATILCERTATIWIGELVPH